MLINKRQRYLLGLVLATTLSANIQSASAINTEPVGDLQGSAFLYTSISSSFAPLAPTKLHLFNSNQYEAYAPLISVSQNTHPTAAFPNYDGGLFQVADSMTEAMEEAIVGFTISKYDKNSMAADKVFVSSQHESAMMVVSITSQASTPISGELESKKIPHSPEQNRRYQPNSQYVRRGTLVSTNYNAISMLRTMEDLQNIAYLGMNEVHTEPISDALTRELKLTTHIAFVPDDSCVNLADVKLPTTCQNKNVDKMVVTMPMIQEKTWTAQMNKDVHFWQNMNVSSKVASK
ncbi:hypothetical protein [Nostoc cycadae]|uniref:YVTN beta-propeller repeat-containing protein n=1 Tax=Nostoc cycadae WK-1 TaxID=1861711 RepID=A0A2H6LCE3_9NOSO|nr:hypothetical protein [Nostoc cycadae]GBE90904.1 hypothetical protein NCWK1_0624 [Nostoc cycadae WK-1]